MRPSYFALFLTCTLLSWQIRGFAQSVVAGVPPVARSLKSGARIKQTNPPPAKDVGKQETKASVSAPGVTTPAALALLDGTIKALSRPEGVDVRFEQSVLGRSTPGKVTGRSVTAANKRVHVDLSYKQLERHGQLKLLCDGETFYRLESLPDSNSLVTYSLKDLQSALDKLVTNETERVAKEDVEKEQLGMHGFEGLSAMVGDLKKRMAFGDPVATTINLPGKPNLAVKMIEGRWNAEAMEAIAPVKKTSDANQQDQRYLWNEKLYYFMVPRMARFYFDAGTQQFVRLELWGVTEKQGPEKILSTLDITSITPLTTLDAKLFQPTEAELKYKRETVNLAEAVKSKHQQTLNIMKMQQGGK